ncbi:hypothetical protein GCM10011502_30040 [Oceanisphaera marina]|uniref:CopG family transcriptional regulator n=1 Tax=Oceanisphaera marina TaxID=2017550 RepID=A0ABQ1IXX6_9GAMM|nr:hypothetical protein [Oceanisphaera marina]GGB55061.1 hypothetical protein GCM10011502_30040 [Oceanisphaera marina]
MSKLNDWTATPSRAVAIPKKESVFVRTSVSWTADYPDAINKLLLEAQQSTSDPSFSKSLVMRAAVRALEQMRSTDRIELMKLMLEERDNQG